jgi:Bacterial membrane protein YfhO
VAALALLVFLGLAYRNVVFGGASLVYSDNHSPFEQPGSPPLDGPGLLPTAMWAKLNLTTLSNISDPGATWWQWEPGGEFLRKGIARGEWPFWDPYTAAGTPAMANPTSAFFFPPYLAMVALGDTTLLKNVYFLALLFGAGMFTYLLLREHDLAPVASLFGATAFVFCGALTQNVGAFLGQTVACYPFTLYVTRRFLKRGTGRAAALMAVAYASVALSSFPPLLLSIFGLAVAYAVVFTLRAPESLATRGRHLLSYLAACLLALGLVAFFYFPFFAVARDVPQLHDAYRDAGAIALPYVSLFQLLSPVLAGTDKVHFAPALRSPFYMELPYIGFVTAFAVCLAAPSRRGDRSSLFGLAAIAAIVATLKLVGVEPVQSLARLPVLNTVHFAAYLGHLLNFLLAILAAIGIDRLQAGQVKPLQAAVAALAGEAALLGLWSHARDQAAFAHPAAGDWIERFVAGSAFVLIASAVTLLVCGQRGESRWLARAAIGLVLLLAAEGVYDTYYPRQLRWDAWRHPPPYVKALLDRPEAGRVFSVFGLHANSGAAVDLFGLDSLHAFNPPRVWRLYERYTAPQPVVFLRYASTLPPEGVLDRANIGLFAIWTGSADFVRQTEGRGYREAFRDANFLVLRRRTEPRYFFTSEYQVTDPDAALERVGTLPPGRLILLEAPGSSPSRFNSADDPAVEVRDFGRNEYTLHVNAPRPGFIYASESFFTGWSATVNGRSAAIVPANFAFRAVEVPAGPAEVRLWYWPPGLTLGLWVTGASAALLGAWVIGERALVAFGRRRVTT